MLRGLLMIDEKCRRILAQHAPGEILPPGLVAAHLAVFKVNLGLFTGGFLAFARGKLLHMLFE